MAGSDPTFGSCLSQGGLALKALNALNLFGSTNAPNWLDMEDAARTALDGVYLPELLAVLEKARGAIAAPLAAEELQAAWRPVFLEICRAVDLPELGGDDVTMLRAIRQYMVDQDLHIKSRGLTYGTPTARVAPANAGDTTFHRNTVDKDGFPLPTGAEAKQARCTSDHNSGTRKRAERWRLTGTPPGDTNLQWEGSGFDAKDVEAAHPLSGRILRNPSFDQNGATADNTAPSSTTAITGWTLNTAANWRLRSAAGYFFATYPGAPTTQWGLECVASDSIAQVLNSANQGAAYDPEKSYFVSLRWKRKSSATGTITLRHGAQSTSVSIVSGVNDAWNHLLIPVGTGSYFQNFNEQDLDFRIEVATLAVGTVVLSYCIVAEMRNADGTHYLPVAGATPALREDLFSWTDSDGVTRAILAYLLWLAFGADGWLPSVANATQVVASGGRTLTFANVGAADTITASSGDFTADGFKPGMLLTSTAGTGGNNFTNGPIASVSALVITMTAATALTNEGPVSAGTLDATPSNVDPT